MPAIDPNKMRHRIEIQAPSSTRDDFGGIAQSWNTVACGWASIEMASQRDTYGTGALASDVTHVITLRYQPATLSAGMRVVFGTHFYTVQALDNVEESGRWLRLFVLAVNDQE